MSQLVQPRLVNEPYSDPCVYLDFRYGRRALLFDLGDLSPLSSREIVRVTHVFVTHMHMDHFIGFDRLLRLNLYQNTQLQLFGPPGLGDAVAAKLAAYTWNLVGPHSPAFAITASEWSAGGFVGASRFSARDAFARREVVPPPFSPPVLVEDADFRVEAALLDHAIPCLAFAFQETLRVNVRKARLDEMGLPVGHWLTEAKRAVRRGDSPQTVLEVVPGRSVTIGALLQARALNVGPGQRVAYATDFGHEPENVSRVLELARGADTLFIEAPFLDADRAMAAAKKHLTAAQAGSMARIAGVARAIPMHFSARYLENQDALRVEFEANFAGGFAPDP